MIVKTVFVCDVMSQFAASYLKLQKPDKGTNRT